VRLLLFLLILPISFSAFSAFSAVELPSSFTVSGKLFDSPTGDTPLADANVEVRTQILNSAKTCVLYDEAQTISTLTTEGA
jgi:hypothetical protein